MDNISGNANYTSDQELSEQKVTPAKKVTRKPRKKINVNDDIDLYKQAVDLYDAIQLEYKATNMKKLSDALVSVQGAVEILKNLDDKYNK